MQSFVCMDFFRRCLFLAIPHGYLPLFSWFVYLLYMCFMMAVSVHFISFSIYRLIDLLIHPAALFLIYPQACSCIELFFVYISLSKMICAWAFYSIYLAALLVHMVAILNIIGVACHHLCSINSLTNLTRPVLIKFHPLILPYKAKPIKKAKQVLGQR